MSRLLLISVALLALTSSLVRAEDGVEEETTTTTPETPAKPQGYVPPTQSSAYDVPWQDMDTFLANRSLAIVVIYSHECPACMNYMPEFDQAVEAYHAAIDPKADSGLVFVRVNGLDGSTDWTMDHSITAFPTVRLFANGAFVKKNLHETARSAADITTMFQRMNARMLSRASPTIAREQDLDKIFKEVVMEERRTLVVAQFASEEAPSDADPGEKASSCRVAFAAGMAELVDLDYFTVHTTRVDGVSKAARSKIEVDITLKGFTAQHPDLTTVCTTYSLITILRCSGATSTSPCKVVGASMPIPSTTDELVRALVTHGVPEAVQMTPATAPLLTKIWMDRSIPQSSRGLHPRRIEQRTRPTFVYFAELKACEEDTPEYKWAKYIKRTVRSIAVDYPNITLMVADQYEFSTLYLRLGFNRQDSRDGIVMGIYADGLRYSSHSLNFTKFKPEIIREFLDAFNSGQLEPYITSVKYSKKTEGPIKIAGQMSSIGFFNTLWRVGEPVPTPPPRGGVEDVFLVVVAHKRCFHCGAIIDNFEKLIDARNRRVARTGGAVAGSAQFLTIPRDNSIAKDAPAKRVDIDLDAVVNGATTEANAKGLVLERLVPIFINGTENYPATEMWQPTLTSNLRPIIGTCVRVSQVAYKDGKPYWEVTAHAPGFMDFTSNRFAHSPPTAMHLLDLIVSEWDRHVNFGQTVVRAEK